MKKLFLICTLGIFIFDINAKSLTIENRRKYDSIEVWFYEKSSCYNWEGSPKGVIVEHEDKITYTIDESYKYYKVIMKVVDSSSLSQPAYMDFSLRDSTIIPDDGKITVS